MPRARAIDTPMLDRLRASRTEVVDLALALKLARVRRDQLVRQAIDEEHISQRIVGEAVGLTGPRVAAIMARPDDDEDGDE